MVISELGGNTGRKVSLSPRPVDSPCHSSPLCLRSGSGVETRHSAAIAVLGHKYDGDILFNINSHLLLI